MRYLGIDFGEKRVGIALSDESGRMAFPKGVLPNDRHLVSEILTLIDANGVGTVVMGKSLDRQMQENPVMERAYTLAAVLKKERDVAIEFENEQYTSEAAKRIQGETGLLDASAAAIILQSYIDRKSGQ